MLLTESTPAATALYLVELLALQWAVAAEERCRVVDLPVEVGPAEFLGRLLEEGLAEAKQAAEAAAAAAA